MKVNEAQKREQFEQCTAQYSTLINKICYMYASDMDNFNDLRQEVLINVWQGLKVLKIAQNYLHGYIV